MLLFLSSPTYLVPSYGAQPMPSFQCLPSAVSSGWSFHSFKFLLTIKLTMLTTTLMANDLSHILSSAGLFYKRRYTWNSFIILSCIFSKNKIHWFYILQISGDVILQFNEHLSFSVSYNLSALNIKTPRHLKLLLLFFSRIIFYFIYHWQSYKIDMTFNLKKKILIFFLTNTWTGSNILCCFIFPDSKHVVRRGPTVHFKVCS